MTVILHVVFDCCRDAWAAHFREHNIEAAFWSALEETDPKEELEEILEDSKGDESAGEEEESDYEGSSEINDGDLMETANGQDGDSDSGADIADASLDSESEDLGKVEAAADGQDVKTDSTVSDTLPQLTISLCHFCSRECGKFLCVWI